MQPIQIPSSRGMQNSSVEVYTNNDGSNGVLFCADGVGEMGKTTHAGGSIPSLIENGGTIPGGLLVVNVQKPQDGNGMFQAERYLDAVDWVIKTYLKADQSRFSATGLSLSGGAIYQIMANPAWSKKFAALVPVAGTKDVTYQSLISGVKASPVPFRAYGSSKDNNTPTQEAFTTYSYVAGSGFDPEKILNKYGQFIDLFITNGVTTHGGTWQTVYNFGNTDFWNWLLQQKRNDATTAVIPPVTPPTKKVVATIDIPAVTIPAKKLTVYDDGSYDTV